MAVPAFLPRLFADAAFALVAFALPVLMVLANRSSLATFAVAAVCAAVSALLSGRFIADFLRFLRGWICLEGLIGGAFLIWCFASTGWSGHTGASFFAIGEAVIAPAALLTMLTIFKGPPPRWLPAAAFAGVAIALAGLAFELRDGLLLRHLLSDRVFTYSLNRPMVVVFLVFAPCLGLLIGKGLRTAAILAVLALVVVALLSDSGSTVFGLIAAAVAYAAASVRPRAAVRIGLALALVALIFAPYVGATAKRLLPPGMVARIEASHAEERLQIWRSFGAVAWLRPWTGIGFDASPKITQNPLVEAVAPELRPALGWGHPHNAFLQVWVELGIPGVLLVAAGLCLLFRRLLRMDAEEIPLRLAATAGVIAIAVESHGAWQGWWFAGIGAQIFLFTYFARMPKGAEAQEAVAPA